MNTHYFSFPSKTFLTGEYAVLEEAPAVLINTNPRFCFSVTNNDDNTVNTQQPFHKDSPAGQYLKNHPHINKQYNISCTDPHDHQGGFGLSSAEFNMAYLLNHNLKLSKDKTFLFKIWKTYKSISFKGVTPSGADLISQWVGKICVFHPKPFHVQSFDWPFSDLDFLILRTNLHLQTWKHLQNLTKSIYPDLIPIAEKAVECITNSNKNGFLEAIKKYSFYLNKNNLIHENTNVFLKNIQQIKEIITAKGCGAMGAESILLFFHTKDKNKVFKELVENAAKYSSGTALHITKNNIIATSQNIAEGVLQHKTKNFKDTYTIPLKNKD